jgi:hypothetical protein
LAITYLSGNRIQGIAGVAVPFASGTITSFVWDFDWYRGSGDTSDEGNKNSNRVFISSNTAGYEQTGQASTARQI